MDPQEFEDAVKDLRDGPRDRDRGHRPDVQRPATVAQSLDSQESGEQAPSIVGIATVVLILVLLAIIFRSVIIALMPILAVGLVSQVATGLIGIAANKSSTSRPTPRSRRS